MVFSVEPLSNVPAPAAGGGPVSPQIVQMVSSNGNTFSFSNNPITDLTYTLPHSVLGNALVLFMNWDKAQTATISDNVNGSWSAASGTITSSGGSQKAGAWFLANGAAG